MLDKKQLTDLFDHLQTPRAGRELITRARITAPVREVKSHGGNVLTFFSSRKMRTDIRTESRHIEFAAAVDMEFDESVLEYYAQPTELKMELIESATGEIRKIEHIPDFLVIRADGFTLEEWKSVAKLESLVARAPHRYMRGTDGRFYAPQIEEQLADMGIRYRIRCDEDIPRLRIENLLHLADYFHNASGAGCPPSELSRLKAVLKDEGMLYLADLLAEPLNFQADDVLQAIADQEVVADLDREPLFEPRRCRLYRDVTLRDFMVAQPQSQGVPGQELFVVDVGVGAVVRFEGQSLKISLLGEQSVICTREDGSTLTLTRDWLDSAIENRQVTVDGVAAPNAMNLAAYSEDDLKEALQRQAILEGRGSHLMKCDRTLRRWIARQAVAAANGEDEVLALVPRTYLRGNRRPRMSPIQLDLMARVTKSVWSQAEAVSYTSCHEALVVACDDAGVPTPSMPTLVSFIKATTTNQDVRNRHGKRVAYQEGAFVEVLKHDTPVHGSRPFQYVHIDHTELDIELISSRTGKPLGRPWLTLVIDAFTRRVLAFYLCFHPPSYVSVMMSMRDFVRRHGRLPEFIITDNGKDLRATAFMLFLKAMGVHQRLRPAGRPRHGSVLERLFGILNTQYIHNLAGNTTAMKVVRMTTGKHLPVNFAEWTLENLYHGIEHWAFQFYDQEVHPALGMSPREMFQRGQKISGTRPQRRIIYNQEFLIATCPPADRGGQRKVHPQTGVKVGDRHYLHADFRDSRFAEKQAQVRVDPWDASSVYVRLGHHWVRARCNSLVSVGQLTETEHRAFAAEFRARHRGKAKGPEDVQRLREFRQVFTPEGAMATALEREAENKALYNQFQMASVSPVAAPSKTCLIEEKPVGAPAARPSESAPAAPARKGVPKARQRSTSPSTSTPSSPQPPETPAADDLPDFDEF